MVRTQIYLTEHQRAELAAIARRGERRQSELIREAIDDFIERRTRHRRETVLREAAGMWSDRCDLPDYEAIRAEWDRHWIDVATIPCRHRRSH